MTKSERELLLFVAEALSSPWCDVVRGISYNGEKSPKAVLCDLIEAVKIEGAVDVTPKRKTAPPRSSEGPAAGLG